MRLGLGTFDTADDAARAYDATTWCPNRPRRDMNFPEVMTMEWAQNLTPRPRVVTEEDHRQNRRRERRLNIAEIDEHAMTEAPTVPAGRPRRARILRTKEGGEEGKASRLS
ncbi:Ethylene-responsive transcription factor CRF1 [Hordeum vulgare]|nr:Ethylene-responsive transcription factor CRF1 [Hordeum vulgare]